jgi:hypothetical protein
MRTRKGTYHASYLVQKVEDAITLLAAMEDAFASSFGDGDDQWEGLYLTDPGTIVTIIKDLMWVRVEVRIPVMVVPKNYWLSPYPSEGPTTFALDGSTTGGEPYDWGMTFRQGGRK